jgi:hypothetical protein
MKFRGLVDDGPFLRIYAVLSHCRGPGSSLYSWIWRGTTLLGHGSRLLTLLIQTLVSPTILVFSIM